ncbi:MAG: hypothetical protein ABL989_16365 [Gammaproteobacteria bacterium]
MRRVLIASSMLLLVAACGGKDDKAGAGGPGPAAESLPVAEPAPGAAAPGAAPADPAAAPAAAPAPTGLDGRTGELVNPDNNAMVFLYYDLTGIAPPVDRWVEDDNRVKYIPAIDRPAQRVAVKAELEAGLAAVRGTGVIRLSLNSANLSDYDPTYGEFTVRALSPSSLVEFAALGQKVSVKFANGKYAQIWKVPAAEAQVIRDKLSMSNNVDLEVLLAIKSVLPGPAGGTITTDVVEYELRETRGGTTLARVRMPAT